MKTGLNALITSAGGWLLLLPFLLPAQAQEWPCYQGDTARSGVTSSTLTFPLSLNWLFQSAPPQPAWPEPGRTANWFDFDYAFQPVAAENLAYVASSSEDTLYALHAADGRVAWTFTADAPIRTAPHISKGRCIFAADDGVVYCLDAQTGRKVWSYRCFPDQRMIAGNGRMISRWPCRSGVLVSGEVVYGTAGMWPSEGVCIFALDAQTGQERWLNDTVNSDYMLYPHDGLSFGGPTPQGALLCDAEAGVLLVPTGQSMPAGFDMATGKLLYWEPRAAGSTWATVTEGMTMVAGRGWQGDQDIRLGECGLWESDGIAGYNVRDGHTSRMWSDYDKVPGTPRSGKERYRGMVGPIAGRDRMVHANRVLYSSGMNAIEAVDTSGKELKLIWRSSAPRIYALIAAGNALLCGTDGMVMALNLRDGQTLWSAPVKGQARGLAITDGRLLVTTDRGIIYSFGDQKPSAPPPPPALRGAEPGRQMASPSLPPGLDLPADLKGFGLVIGCHDTAVAEALAAHSALHVICLLQDERLVAEARRKLLGKGYGTHLSVHTAAADGGLPYADYFANVVLAYGTGGAVQPAELYRVLQPCTGKLLLPDAARKQAEAFMDKAGIPAAERVAAGSIPSVVRGPLAGAFDWNSEKNVDQRLKWPLELLWFGGPGRDRMLRRHGRWYPPPIPAHGRVFMEGESHVMAVDAYNGTELWSWYLPGFRSIYADDQHAYIRGDRVLKCDARSGRILTVYGDVKPFVFDLRQPQRFDAKAGNSYSGSILITREQQSIRVEMTTRTPTPHDSDCWMLHFDFREAAERLLPPARGAFTVIVNTRKGTIRKYNAVGNLDVPELTLAGFTPGGDTLSLRLTDDAIRTVAKKIPDSFDMRAELLLYEYGRETPRRRLRELPLTGERDFMRNGTATFVLRGDAAGTLSPAAIVAKAERRTLPLGAEDWGRVPNNVRHDGNIPRLPLASERKPDLQMRNQSITDTSTVLKYERGYGCSGTISSSTMDFFRSGTLGIYDLEDDSGMRNFSGMKPGCGVSLLPALGLLISGESNADCFCPYNFATSLALAPASERSNEDWALFYDELKLAEIRNLALNIAAPGDRRAPDGTLWLGYPRQPLMDVKAGPTQRPHTFGMPLAIHTFDGARPLRVNADRVPISGTDTPWLYASALTGIKDMTLGLLYYNPRTECLALPVKEPITVDGRLDESFWLSDTGVSLATRKGAGGENARLRIRYDAKFLYLGYEEDAAPDGTGRVAWNQSVTGSQTEIWRDDHISVTLKDTRLPVCAQFGTAAGGGRYSSDVSWRMAVPAASDITIDGDAKEWKSQGLDLPIAEDRGRLRIGWTPEGLAVLTVLHEGFFSRQKSWNALRVQIVNPDNSQILETVILPSSGTIQALKAAPLRRDDGTVDTDSWESLRKSLPQAMDVASAAAGSMQVSEALFPWDALGIKAAPSARCGLKITAFNPEASDGNIASGAGARKDLLRGEMLCVLELSANKNGESMKEGSTRQEWYGSVILFEPEARPLALEKWSSAVTVNKERFCSEMAIPLSLLADVGLAPDHLDIAIRPPFKVLPQYDSLRQLKAHERRLQISPPTGAAGRYTVRMHFAELAEVKAGVRVFDIRLQGKTVAEGVDVAVQAGGTRRALIRTFRNIEADKVMQIEWIPRGAISGGERLPIVNGIELIREK